MLGNHIDGGTTLNAAIIEGRMLRRADLVSGRPALSWRPTSSNSPMKRAARAIALTPRPGAEL